MNSSYFENNKRERRVGEERDKIETEAERQRSVVPIASEWLQLPWQRQ